MLPFDGMPPPDDTENSFGEAVGGLLSALLTGCFIWLCAAGYNALFLNVFGQSVYVILAVIVSLGTFGAAFYVFRDRRKSKMVATLQVVIAIAAGTVATLGAETLSLKIITALSAVVVTSNGIGKLFG